MIRKNNIDYAKCSTELTALLDYMQKRVRICAPYWYWKQHPLVVSVGHDGHHRTWYEIKKTIKDLQTPRNLFEHLVSFSDPKPRDAILINSFAITRLSHFKFVHSIELPDIEEDGIISRLLVKRYAQKAIVNAGKRPSIIVGNVPVPLPALTIKY